MSTPIATGLGNVIPSLVDTSSQNSTIMEEAIAIEE